MIFLNIILLGGLAGIAIPILIHILSRRQARVIEWGAMQFLELSMASRNRRIQLEEMLLLALRCLIVGLLAMALALPFLRHRMVGAGSADAQDLAIVIDGSMSMTLDVGGRSNFQRAIDEAHQLVQACRPKDAVCILLAGPTPQATVPSPVSDKQSLHQALDGLTPSGGSMGAVEALNAAIGALSAGTNPAKRIVLITDGQAVGWDLSAAQRWGFLANAAAGLSTPPSIVVRTLEPPAKWHNAAVASVSFSRAIVGTDRPVKITATIANTGRESIAPDNVELFINGRSIERRPLSSIAEGASASVVFEHRFEQSGPQLVSVHLNCDDDLPGDNDCARVVDVLRVLPVLVVEGMKSSKPLGSDADYIAIALAPPADKDEKVQPLVVPTVVAAADVGAIKDFSAYGAVIMANVPRLAAPAAKALADYVAQGGGLLIAPGERADREFLNGWATDQGKRVTGCQWVQFQDQGDSDKFVRPVLSSMDHPAMKLLADPAGSDLGDCRVTRYWQLTPDPADAQDTVAVGAKLESGHPLLVQRRLGRGLVITLAVPLSAECSDLPVRECFVPLVHELIYHLCTPGRQSLNLLPGEQLVYNIPGRPNAGDGAEVAAPDGQRSAATLQQRQGRWQATFSLTAVPGLYRLYLSPAALGELASRPGLASTAPRAMPAVPFVVQSDPQESHMDVLSADDYRRAGKYLPIQQAEALSDVLAVVQGGVPGAELWGLAAWLLLALLVAEIAITRAIAARRRTHMALAVDFGVAQVDAKEFRAQTRRKLQARPGAKP